MSLKEQCIKNITEVVKTLPPLLKEEVVGKSLKTIREDIKKEVIKDIGKSAYIIIEDMTYILIKCQQNGGTWERPEYTKDIDENLFYTFVRIAEANTKRHFDHLQQNYGVYSDPDSYGVYSDSDPDSY